MTPRPISQRARTLAACRVAGYHGDSRGFLRAYVEGRVHVRKAQKAFTEGERARAAGVPCGCSDCADEAIAKAEGRT